MIGLSRLVEAFERREHVFYMDEAIFSSKQVSPIIWYAPQTRPIFLPKKKTSFKAIAVAAAIDMKGKVVAY